MNVCVSSAVFKDKNLHLRLSPDHPFRSVSARPPVRSSPRTLKASSDKDPKDVKVAIIHEDGPYGSRRRGGQRGDAVKTLGIQVVHKEGYSATATDLSRLVTKLRRTQPDIILHAGYNPDITPVLASGARGRA